MRAGAFDLLTKPLIDEELEMAIERALRSAQVIEENKNLKAQLDLRFGLENIVGHDHRMLRVFDMIDSVADTKATVLITGESGTGKSLIARAIHRRSARRDKPFVEVACGALPENAARKRAVRPRGRRVHRRDGDKIGKFLQADGGTIFLDEIGTASPGMQVKLLRVLQEFEFEPVGGNKTFSVDTRVILATNEDLAEAVAEGRFRQDLYYRINVINIELPPLRERISRHSAAGPALSAASLRRGGQARCTASRDEAMAALQRYAGRATSANCKTWSSGPCCSARADTIAPRRPAATRWRPVQPVHVEPLGGTHAEGSPRSARAADHSAKCWKATTGTATRRPKPWASTAPRSTRR